jgi:hypothetical protein
VIARTRKRARVKSISLRTFGWLCTRQAAYQLLATEYNAHGVKFLRLALMRLPLASLRRLVAPLLRDNPHREGRP